MPYRIEFVNAAKTDLRALRKSDRVKVLDRIETHLTHEPKLSPSIHKFDDELIPSGLSAEGASGVEFTDLNT